MTFIKWLCNLLREKKEDVTTHKPLSRQPAIGSVQAKSDDENPSLWNKRLREMQAHENPLILIENLKKQGSRNVANHFKPMDIEAALSRLHELKSNKFKIRFYRNSAYASRSGHIPNATEGTYLHKISGSEFVEYSFWDVSD
jgi:hypothetical protein